MRLAFLWQGFDGRYGQWKDGLWAAMQLISQKHDVRYFDLPLKGLEEFNPDFVLYWEAPVTFAGKDRENYWSVQQLPYKKALLFAGGQIRKEWVDGFSLLFVESRINEKECAELEIPYKRAFGTNTQIFKPEKQPKVFDGMFQATCASWKRHWLIAEALHEKAVICGRFQETDPIGFMRAREQNAVVLPELSQMAVSSLLNASHTAVNCSDVWGGGQRSTLEAMACGIPVVAMEDSPKNREFVEESGFGTVCDPKPQAISEAVARLKEIKFPDYYGVEYIQSKWTEKHYADAIIEGLNGI